MDVLFAVSCFEINRDGFFQSSASINIDIDRIMMVNEDLKMGLR